MALQPSPQPKRTKKTYPFFYKHLTPLGVKQTNTSSLYHNELKVTVNGQHFLGMVTIGILNFSFPDRRGQERYLREVQLIDKVTQEVFYDKLTFIYLEMPKFRKNEDELISQFDKWMYVLKNLHLLQERPVKLQEKVFEKLFSEAEIAKLKPEDMKAYEESLKTYRDNHSVIETAKSDTRIEIAKRLKSKGINIETIAETRGYQKNK